MSRKIRTKLTQLPRNLLPVLSNQRYLQERKEMSRVNMKLNFDKHHAAKLLPILREGDEVWLRDRKESAKVHGQANSKLDRSYVVKTPTVEIRRNRVQLNKLPSEDAAKSEPSESNKYPVPKLVPKPPE